MSLDARLAPWSGEVFRHLPDSSDLDVLDFRFAGRAATNRWNCGGEPTLYLASEVDVALAEFSRHLMEFRSPALARLAVRRQVYRLRVEVERALRLAECYPDLGLTDAPACFLDKAVARATAHYVRRVTAAQGIFVPSRAFLDREDAWTLVLFLEKLPAEVARFVPSVERVGTFRVEAG